MNPSVPRAKLFGDDYSFAAYNAAGFSTVDKVDKEAAKNVKLAAPTLDLSSWWNYITNVMAVSPIEKGKKGIPEGVLRLGGTFVVSGDDVLYQWSDTLPGDHPELDDVIKVAKDAAQK